MCGIVGYVGDRDCADVLVDALSKLEYRGYDSAGIAVFEKGTIKVEKCKGRLANLVDKMAVDGKPQGSSSGRKNSRLSMRALIGMRRTTSLPSTGFTRKRQNK